jgi:hypothetical protein
VVTFYAIRDADGEIVAVHERTDGPDGKRLKWRQPDGTIGLNGTSSTDLPLYGAENLGSWPMDATVVVTEGEKDADALRVRGIHVLATVTGASATPSAAVLEALAGRHVVLWPDNDKAGTEHMAHIAKGLEGVAATVRVVTPSGDKGDGAADYSGDPWDAIDAAGLVEPSWRTLADIPDDPPAPLLLGMLEPSGATLAYGAPGVGKGSTGAWLVVESQRSGMRPLIYDAERREREWSRRVGGLGGDRSRIPYVVPADLGTTRAGRPFWQAVDGLTPILRATGADLLLVDSVLPAVGLAEERLRSDASVPFQFVAALDGLAVTSLTFGHPPKGQPEGEPFGSFAWVAAFRLTWLGTRAEGDGHRVRWRVRKRNERGRVPGTLLTFGYTDERLTSVDNADDEETTRDWLLDALADGSRTIGELVELLLEDEDEPPTEAVVERTKGRLRQALNRMRRLGLVTSSGSARDRRWSRRG